MPEKRLQMTNLHLNECQIPCLSNISEGPAELDPLPLVQSLKRKFARPWNYSVKRPLKRRLNRMLTWYSKVTHKANPAPIALVNAETSKLANGDWVRVRSAEEIRATLDAWKELKGCAFLEYMWPYCGTTQRVLQVMQRFLDERDYKVKRVKGVILLEGVICHGTPIFGRCDRCCHLFWREEWLEKIDAPTG
jgi:hypothetical protein